MTSPTAILRVRKATDAGKGTGPLFVSLVLILASCVGCADLQRDSGTAQAFRANVGAARADGDWFIESAGAVGLDFIHVNGTSGHFYYPEILPPGVALFDYDNDGDLDVFVVQGHMLGTSVPQPGPPEERTTGLGARLFRNDLQVHRDGTRTLRFTDITGRSGIAARGYGLGVATGDIDNDGWIDLYITNFGSNQMLRNNGNGTFSDVTLESRTSNEGRFGVSAAFLDYDRDGWLDLFVANNVRYTIDNRTVCPSVAGTPDYCPPQTYGGQPDRLYRNFGHGLFRDVSASALIGGDAGPALGVSTADFDNDGWIDIYVANDGAANLLWLNRHNGTFEEVALKAGAALTAEGIAEASMGVDAGDFDNDGDEDLIITELTGQGANLFVNTGDGTFEDRSAPSGIGAASQPYTGFGAGWVDVDNDGWLDVFSVNGTVIALEGRKDAFPYDQPKQLLRNLGNGRFNDVTLLGGGALSMPSVGRGAAFGDVDNDGDIDVLVGNDNRRAQLLLNMVGSRNHWLGLSLVSAHGPRDDLGARVTVRRGVAPALRRRARSDGSYGSASDSRVLVGLGDWSASVGVEVQWSSGRREKWADVGVDRWIRLREGSGQ